jgi:hypothetical protein
MNIAAHEHDGKWYIHLQNRWHWSAGGYWTDRYEESRPFDSETAAREFLEKHRDEIEKAS